MAAASWTSVALKPTTPFLSLLPPPPASSPISLTLGFKRHAFRVNAVATKWEPSKVVPQADRILLRLEELSETSAGGLLLPTSAVKFDRYLVGQVLSVGSEVEGVDPGKKVLLSDLSAYEVVLGSDARHCFCKAGDLLAVVE